MGSTADRILHISREEISPDYLTREELREFVNDPNRHVYVYDITQSDPVLEITAARDLGEEEGEILGFALTGTFNRDSYAKIVSVSIDDILARTPLTPDDFPLSQFKVVAVASDQKGKGIGSALTATALTPLFDNPPVTAMIWERDNPANVKIAERYANNQLARFDDYFPDDWRCPVCGFENDCDCAVTMYGWFADERRELTKVN